MKCEQCCHFSATEDCLTKDPEQMYQNHFNGIPGDPGLCAAIRTEGFKVQSQGTTFRRNWLEWWMA